MKKLKYEILFTILIMLVGMAAVTSNLVINGNTSIASNPDDFLVYFSDVLVNGTQDLSLVNNETSLVFNGEFNAVGDKKEITYDVTNASKNYDADVDITCTQSTNYLTITNSFDTTNNLGARQTKTGTLTITQSKSYTGTDLSQEISCTITALAVERTSQGTEVAPGPVSPYYVGKEISILDEEFNVISDNGDTVSLFAKYNLGANFKQTSAMNNLKFGTSTGWEYTPGPKEIDIQVWSTNPKTYVNNYVSYLNGIYNSDSISGDLITGKQLIDLGCAISENYDTTLNSNCTSSKYSSWIINGQSWWTKSAYAINMGAILVITISDVGGMGASGIGVLNGIRPVITIPKDMIDNRIISFTIDGTTYYAEEGMYWSEWVASPYNTAGYQCVQYGLNFRVYLTSSSSFVNDNSMGDTIIVSGKNYTSRIETSWG